MHRFTKMTVALSCTNTDSALLHYAAGIARLGTATDVRFVHAISPEAAESTSVQQAMEADVFANFTDVPASVSRSFEVLRGPMLDRLLHSVADNSTELLFLGHRRDHPGRWALARRLAMRAPCSVWMVPQGAPPTVKRVLVPVDFSEPSGDALRVGTSLAKLTGAACHALHVYFNRSRVSYEEYDSFIRGEEKKAFEKFAAALDLADVKVMPIFEESAETSSAIQRVAADLSCDLIVMATRGRSRSAAILLGSATEAVITETRIPLLVVKHQGAHMSALQALLEIGKQRGPQFD